jgi:hypothetical protein
LVALWVAACGGDDSGGPSDGGSSGGTVVGSPECMAFCANLRNACGPGTRCDEDFFCRVRMGECAASARGRLQCSSMMMPTCLDGGWIVGSCSADNTLCGGD